VSQPEQPPRFFLDRSLGRKAVPEVLRADGWDVITLAEHYGMPADEQVADTDWIKEAARVANSHEGQADPPSAS
jgi:hypothetical protein